MSFFLHAFSYCLIFHFNCEIKLNVLLLYAPNHAHVDIVMLIMTKYVVFLQLIEDVAAMLDVLAVWETGSEWTEMSQMGLSILLDFAGQKNLDVRIIFYRANIISNVGNTTERMTLSCGV